MSFSDHKITAFTHRIADLPDQPNLPADELKARFDSSPEELRTAHNAVCDDVQTLSDKVDNIITETFDGVIEKSMLSGSLAAELDAKAVESSVASRIAAEQTARESGDSALSTRVTALESKVPERAQLYRLRCTGTGGSKSYTLPFTPDIVFSVYDDCGRVAPNAPLAVAQGATVVFNNHTVAKLSGSTLTLYDDLGHNEDGRKYTIIAIA